MPELTANTQIPRKAIKLGTVFGLGFRFGYLLFMGIHWPKFHSSFTEANSAATPYHNTFNHIKGIQKVLSYIYWSNNEKGHKYFKSMLTKPHKNVF